MEVILAGAATYFFTVALTPRETTGSEAAEKRQTVGLLFLTACLLMAATPLMVLHVVSIGRLLAVLVVLTAAFKGGMLPGCAAGVSLGLAMDMAAGGEVFFAMAYGFAGLIGGAFAKHGRLLFLVSYVLANTVAVLWTYGQSLRIESMYEVFSATVISGIKCSS